MSTVSDALGVTENQLPDEALQLETEYEESDDFLKEELLLAALLLSLVYVHRDTVMDIANEVRKTTATALDIFDRAGDVLTDIVPAKAQTLLKATHAATILRGAGEAIGGVSVIKDAPIFDLVKDGMMRAAKYTTNNYFNRIVMPELTAEVARLLADPLTVMTQNVYDGVLATLSARLKNVPYWRVVGQAAASRAYTYGVLKAGQLTGYIAYRYDAILDERTSEICTHLNGREFWIADALRPVEESALSESIEDTKRLMPWLSFSEIQNLSTDELVARGVIVPPRHGNCRSRLTLIRS